VGYQTSVTQGVLVTTDKITFLNIQMSSKSELLEEIVVKEYKVPLIKEDETSTGATVTKEDIENLPTRNVTSIVSTSAGVYQSDEGEDVNVKGSRSEATDYYIDGVKVRGSSALPTAAIEQVNVVTGGVPAKYGDATGGIINITTRGPSPTFSGGIELESSQITDPYNYNLIGLNLGGPIVKVNKGEKNERPLIGFHITGQYVHQKDPDPSAIGVWHLNDAKQAEIEASPLTPLPLGGFDRSSQYITMEDLELNKAKKDIPSEEIGATARLDFSPTRNINFRVGANYINLKENRYIESYQLMNRQGNDLETSNAYRGYARFTQRFGNALERDEDAEPNLFQNAFYSVQFDYTKSTEVLENLRHRDDLWSYGHVGKFETFRGPTWDFNDEFNLIELVAVSDTLVTYTPGESNPLMAAHTSQYYDLAGDNSFFYNNINSIEVNRGIINGTRSASLQSAHNIWYNPGRIVNGYRTRDNDQYRLSFNGSVDIKKAGSSDRNKHALEFGVEYEQRIDREYLAEPVGFWSLGRQLVNSHLELNTDEKYIIRDGETIHQSQWAN